MRTKPEPAHLTIRQLREKADQLRRRFELPNRVELVEGVGTVESGPPMEYQ
jgi:hypothetical protein